MLRLTTWQPLTPMFQLRRDIDDLFGRFVGQMAPEGSAAASGPVWTPAVEGAFEDGAYLIRVALPGVETKDVEVSVADDTLTIKGQRKREKELRREHYFATELAYGAFERSFTLPEGIDTGKVTAKWTNGILEIRVPAPVEVAPRKVSIEVDGGTAKAA